MDTMYEPLTIERGVYAVAWGRQTTDRAFFPVLRGNVSRAASLLCRATAYLNFSNQSLVFRGSLSTQDSGFGNPLPWALLCLGHGLDGLKDGHTYGEDTPACSCFTHAHTHRCAHTCACTGTQCSKPNPLTCVDVHLSVSGLFLCRACGKMNPKQLPGRLFHPLPSCITPSHCFTNWDTKAREDK